MYVLANYHDYQRHHKHAAVDCKTIVVIIITTLIIIIKIIIIIIIIIVASSEVDNRTHNRCYECD